MAHSGLLDNVWRSSDLPCARLNADNRVVLRHCVFYAVQDHAQYTLFDLEVFVLLKMDMSVMSATEIGYMMMMMSHVSLTVEAQICPP